MSADKLQEIKNLTEYIDRIETAVTTSEEEGLFKNQTEVNVRYIHAKLRAARSNLMTDRIDIPLCRRNFDEASQEYYEALNNKRRRWQYIHVYGYDALAYLIAVLIFVTILYFYFIHCSPTSKLCFISFLGVTNSTGNPTKIGNTTESMTIGTGLGLGDGSNAIGSAQSGTVAAMPSISLPQNAVYAILWGVVGGVLRGLYTLWEKVSSRRYRTAWRVWVISIPFISGILGGISYFLIIAGLLVLSQTSTPANTSTATFAIIIAAAYAGYNWIKALNWFEGAVGKFSSGGAK
jgi:hypothetical protein